jgi:hypothetical protein
MLMTPVVAMPELDQALAELEWVVQHGARAVLIRHAARPGAWDAGGLLAGAAAAHSRSGQP